MSPRDEKMIDCCLQKSTWETDEEALDKNGKILCEELRIKKPEYSKV